MASRFRIGAALLGAVTALTFSTLPAHADVKITPVTDESEAGHPVFLKPAKDKKDPVKEDTSVIKLKIDDGKNGFLCDVDDVDGMATRALTLLQDDMTARALGKAARESVSRRFCVDKVVPMYEQYYEQISNT